MVGLAEESRRRIVTGLVRCAEGKDDFPLRVVPMHDMTHRIRGPEKTLSIVGYTVGVAVVVVFPP